MRADCISPPIDTHPIGKLLAQFSAHTTTSIPVIAVSGILAFSALAGATQRFRQQSFNAIAKQSCDDCLHGKTNRRKTTASPVETRPPIHSGTSPEPRINGPKVVGCTPGKPFSYLVPATGEGPLVLAANDLPQGLSFDSTTGIISGALPHEGRFNINLTVTGPKGVAHRALRIIAGQGKLALTPPRGWNSWQPYAGKVTDKNIRDNADAMVKFGLAAHGYSVITIDDGWEGSRDLSGRLAGNERFPDMKGLAEYVHSKGLKIGIYSSPGPLTCQRYPGSYQHEEQDAKTFSDWGFDYLKYDLCSLKRMIDTNNLEAMQAPYMLMGKALHKQARDIVYSICQYGWKDVWKWGRQVGGNLWRTTDDIGDAWSTVAHNGFGEAEHAQYAGPGGWNDPDMLVVGWVGPGWAAPLHPSLLTPNEQITHISLWTMAAAPLIVGCDMTKLDQWTIDLLTNDEVLEVNDDPLGKAGERKWSDKSLEVWSRPLEDGSTAVALFNRGEGPAAVTAHWSHLGLKGEMKVRDLWQQKDLGKFTDAFTATVARHGTVLVKLTAVAKNPA